MPTSQELKVLRLLAKEWKHSGPPGILDVSAVVAALDMAPSETLAAIKTLFQNGLIDMDSLKITAFLTPEGHAITEPPEPSRRG